MERLPRVIVGVGAGLIIGVKAWRLWKEWKKSYTAEERRAEWLHSSNEEVTIACPRDLCEVREEEGTSSEVVPCDETTGFEAPAGPNGVVTASRPPRSIPYKTLSSESANQTVLSTPESNHADGADSSKKKYYKASHSHCRKATVEKILLTTLGARDAASRDCYTTCNRMYYAQKVVQPLRKINRSVAQKQLFSYQAVVEDMEDALDRLGLCVNDAEFSDVIVETEDGGQFNCH
ncbi:hypothetical protein BSKO_12504 [Bryopsis sp. KO-2023]|nr:hypothetical protein BSKO_12504 [Bryopsis sp. KO-2023]